MTKLRAVDGHGLEGLKPEELVEHSLGKVHARAKAGRVQAVAVAWVDEAGQMHWTFAHKEGLDWALYVAIDRMATEAKENLASE